MLTNVRRDAAALPRELRERTAATDERHADTLLRAFTVKGARRRRSHAVLTHAVSFWTWRSLCVDGGLSNHEAVQAMTALVMSTATPSGRAATATRRGGPLARAARSAGLRRCGGRNG